MKKAIALGVALVFALGTAGFSVAQEKKAEEKKTEMKSDAKSDTKADKKDRKSTKSANGTVKSAAADSLVVAGKEKGGKEAEWTFGVDAKTSIKKGGKAITAGDVKAGDSVRVQYTEADGKMMAQSVNVRGASTAKKADDKKMDAKPMEKPAEKK